MPVQELDRLRQLVATSRRIVAFTGAGVSTESGIPDFRSPGGVWTRYDPTELTFDRYVADPDVRALSWEMRREFFTAGAEPNLAHRAIADWGRSGRALGVITQNIDGLHQQAGSADVIELHGTALEVMCIGTSPRDGVPHGCGFRSTHAWAVERIETGDRDPRCPQCGGIVKSATVSFGQSLFPESVHRAEDLAARADLMIAVGSSLQVYPAAGLPMTTLAHGGRLAIVNDEPTPLDDVATVVARGRAGEILPELVVD